MRKMKKAIILGNDIPVDTKKEQPIKAALFIFICKWSEIKVVLMAA